MAGPLAIAGRGPRPVLLGGAFLALDFQQHAGRVFVGFLAAFRFFVEDADGAMTKIQEAAQAGIDHDGHPGTVSDDSAIEVERG